MKEIWKDIKGYEGLYLVSSYGRVKALRRERSFCLQGRKKIRVYPEKILKSYNAKDRYDIITLCKSGKLKSYTIHSLVAKTFIKKANDKMQINHKDGNKLNNNLENLEYCTASENIRHAIKNGLIKKGEDNYLAKLKNKQVYEIKSKYIRENKKICELAKEYNISRGHIKNIVYEKSWKWINPFSVTTYRKKIEI